MSPGSAAFAYAAGVMLAMGLSYWFERRGWMIGVIGLLMSVTLIGFTGVADPALLLIETAVGALAMWLAMRWCVHHAAWRQRIIKDQVEAEQSRLQFQGTAQHLKEKIVARAEDVDRSLKQYELVKRLAAAISWEEMSPSLERALKTFFKADGWALYLTNSKGELQLMQKRGSPPEPRGEDLAKQDPYLHTFVAR